MGTSPAKKKTGRSRRFIAFFTILLSAFLVTFLVAAIVSFRFVLKDNAHEKSSTAISIAEKDRIAVSVETNATTEAIVSMLKDKGIIHNTLWFKFLSKWKGYDGMYRAGTHFVSMNLEAEDVMKILSGNPETKRVTLPEGLTVKEIAKRLADGGAVSSSEAFQKICNQEVQGFEFLKGLGSRDFKLEGYLFPDTYEFDYKGTEKDAAELLLSNFKQKFNQEFKDRAKELNMSMDQIIILASIIEREAKNEDDRRKISGVFYNRLNSKDKSMQKLQSCATLQYILLSTQGAVKEKLTDADTKLKSPYNTYENAGLPPGPICSPGVNSIRAALYPEKHDYYYFVARGDGSHQFSRTFGEHQAAARKYNQIY